MVDDESGAPPDPPVRRRAQRRRRSAQSDSLPRYLLTAALAILVVAALFMLLAQLGQLGGQSAAVSPPASTALPLQPSAGVAAGNLGQAAAPVQPARGQGPIKVTSRVLEPTYAVAQGDTLGTIAARFSTSVEALQGLNNLNDRNNLSVGQKLVIPD
jgi:LysM domain-containing protein